MIARFFAEHYAKVANHLRIDFEGGGCYDVPLQLSLALPPAPEGGIDPVEGVPADLVAEIMDRLADTCKRHTREEMALALPERGDSAVYRALWLLRKAEKLNNRKDGHGTGFGLPEWS